MSKAIGHVPCQACGEPAEVRQQKNGRAYSLCQHPDCSFQGFTRSDSADQKLRSRMTPTAAPAAQAPAPAAATPPAITPDPSPKRKGFFDDLQF